MNQVFAGGLALIIALILWSSKKHYKRSAFLQSQKDSFLSNQASTSLIIEKRLKNQQPKKLNNKKSTPFAKEARLNSITIKKELTKLISGNPEDRLLAIQIASHWKHKNALPFLRKGLKDFDSRIVILSATAIESFKGKTIHSQKSSQVSRPPRNVSRMR